LHATHLTPNGVDPAMYGQIVAMSGYAAASNGREMLVAESTDTATAMTTDGRPLRSVPIPAPPAASDGTHWLYFGEFTSSVPPGEFTSSMQIGRTSSTRIMRTALDGSQREEAKFDAPYGWQSLQCGNGACLMVWPANGELWGALLRADRPLASARAQRFAA